MDQFIRQTQLSEHFRCCVLNRGKGIDCRQNTLTEEREQFRYECVTCSMDSQTIEDQQSRTQSGQLCTSEKRCCRVVFKESLSTCPRRIHLFHSVVIVFPRQRISGTYAADISTMPLLVKGRGIDIGVRMHTVPGSLRIR
jgi:hypothetical protein